MVMETVGMCNVNPFCKQNCSKCVAMGMKDEPADCVTCKDGFSFNNGYVIMLDGG